MYKLTVEFKDLEQLTQFVLKQGDSVIGGKLSKEEEPSQQVEAEVITEVPAKKSALRTKKPEAKPSEEPTEEKQGASVVVEQPAVIKPIVQPKAPAPSAPVVEFDRTKAIARATELVNELKASGIADDQLMPNIHAVYAQAGCPLNLRISQFDNPSLEKFLPLFEQKVASIVKPAIPVGSFI